MFTYAQLNENNICIGISQLSGAVNDDKLIPIDSFDQTKLWHKYENGEWSAESFEPVTAAPLTDYEETKQAVEALTIAMAEMMGV